jgi:uncharacterized protein YacL
MRQGRHLHLKLRPWRALLTYTWQVVASDAVLLLLEAALQACEHQLDQAPRSVAPLGLLGLVFVLVIAAVAVAPLIAMPLLLLLLLLRKRVGPKTRSAMARP